MDANDRYVLGEIALAELSGRRGFRQTLDQVDPATRDEIRQAIGDAIAKHLRAGTAPNDPR